MSSHDPDQELQQFFDQLDRHNTSEEVTPPLEILPNHADREESRCRMGACVRHWSDLPEPLRVRLDPLLSALIRNGSSDFVCAPDPPAPFEGFDIDLVDLRWYLAWYQQYDFVRDKDVPWRCPDCRTNVPKSVRYCTAAACIGRARWARVHGEPTPLADVSATPARQKQRRSAS